MPRPDEYAPPEGPPPGWRGPRNPQSNPPQDDYAPPPGPPPNWRDPRNPQSIPPPDYAPPPGPPPNWTGPPKQEQRPQHDWQTAVPDTSLFPPPPAIFSSFDRSPANNATEAEAEAGAAWCAQYPLLPPSPLSQPSLGALQSHAIALVPPAGFAGRIRPLGPGPGHWSVQTAKGSPDRCILAYPPLYSARAHQGRQKTIYYEVKVRHGGTANVALGFTALPYPSFRLPGWHRGSLAVHGDDGNRYVNDTWGGRAFVAPFRAGETYGVGMVFTPAGFAGGRPRVEVQVFFTRDGRREGGWDLHEETDAQTDGGVFGLEGFHDVSCAVGCFEDVDVEIVFEPGLWLYSL